jgi:hypothetical protein
MSSLDSSGSSSSSSDEDDGKKPESGASTEDGVPRQARATVEPTQEEVVEPKDLLEEIDEAKKNELTPKKSKSSGTHDKSGLSRDSPNQRLLNRLAHAGQDYPDPEHIQQQIKEMWDTSWEGLDEHELKARNEKYEALHAQLIDCTKRLITERDTFAAASASLGQKADERGDDTRDLAKIVKNIEQETLEPGSSTNPFEPDGADATGIVPGQMLDTKVKELLQECKETLDNVTDEATKKSLNNLTKMVISVVDKVNNEQHERDTKRRKEDSKVDYHKCLQLKTMEVFDDEDTSMNIATWIDDIAYVCAPHIKKDQFFEAILSKLHTRIQEEVRQKNRKRRAESKHEMTHKELIEYLLHTYKNDSDRDDLVEAFNKVKQDTSHVRNHNRKYKAAEQRVFEASGGHYDSMPTRIAHYRKSIDKDLHFDVMKAAGSDYTSWNLEKWQESAEFHDTALHKQRKEGKVHERVAVVNSDSLRLPPEQWQKMTQQMRQAYLRASREMRKPNDKGGGKGTKRKDTVALVKVTKDADIGFKKVQALYTDEQCKRRAAAIKAEKPVDDPELRDCYDKDYILWNGKKTEACIRCRKVGHMLWNCPHKDRKPKQTINKKPKGGGGGKDKKALLQLLQSAKDMDEGEQAELQAHIQALLKRD